MEIRIRCRTNNHGDQRMLMNLFEATDVVKGMLHTYFLRTNLDLRDICAQRAHFFNDLCTKVCTKF